MRPLPSLAAFALSMLAQPLWAAGFSPHPACLDLDLRQPSHHGLLSAPLPLSRCDTAAEAAAPYEHFGFTSYDRPPDAAGMRGGSVGYQRIAGTDGEVLYVLRVEGGGNGVFDELLIGRELQDAAGTSLVDGRLHGLSSECGGLVDTWREPGGRIHMVLNLSPAEVLQALVAPRAQPPSAMRDEPTLRALFGPDVLPGELLSGSSCPGFAEYELDAALLEWRLNSLRLDIADEADEDALQALTERVPALDADGVAMLLGEELAAVRAALLGKLPRPQLHPRDDTAMDAGFSAFRARLADVVRTRDAAALMGLAQPDVMLGFGGSGGHADLREYLREPASADDYWRSLEDLLQLGSVRMATDVFCLPYPSCVEIAARDPYSVLVVIRPDTPLLEQPLINARALRLLDFDVVQRFDPFAQADARFLRVRMSDGEVGYIENAALRSPLDLRMEIVRESDDWRIRSIIAGD